MPPKNMSYTEVVVLLLICSIREATFQSSPGAGSSGPGAKSNNPTGATSPSSPPPSSPSGSPSSPSGSSPSSPSGSPSPQSPRPQSSRPQSTRPQSSQPQSTSPSGTASGGTGGAGGGSSSPSNGGTTGPQSSWGPSSSPSSQGSQVPTAGGKVPYFNPNQNYMNDYSYNQGDTFAVQVLKAHNYYRAAHGAPPLMLDQNLSNLAQDWANHLASIRRLVHRPHNKYGENLYYGWSTNPNFAITGDIPVTMWYKENRYYTYGSEPINNFYRVGHFTQSVWLNTRWLGVGIARGGRSIYVVCNYDPPGNYMGSFATQVQRPGGGNGGPTATGTGGGGGGGGGSSSGGGGGGGGGGLGVSGAAGFGPSGLQGVQPATATGPMQSPQQMQPGMRMSGLRTRIHILQPVQTITNPGLIGTQLQPISTGLLGAQLQPISSPGIVSTQLQPMQNPAMITQLQPMSNNGMISARAQLQPVQIIQPTQQGQSSGLLGRTLILG